jgi:hypothetical protein
MDETDRYTWIDQMRMRWNGIYARQELDTNTAVSGDSIRGPNIWGVKRGNHAYYSSCKLPSEK